jgi:hypothetical protein
MLFCSQHGLMQVESAGCATVTAFSKDEGRKQRPHGLNTVALLKVASSALNIGPQRAMQVSLHIIPCLRPTRKPSVVHEIDSLN